MEINRLIAELLESGALDNQSMGIALLQSDDVTEDQKRKHLGIFVRQYTEGKINFFDEEHKDLFADWMKMYQELSTVIAVKERVKNIE